MSVNAWSVSAVAKTWRRVWGDGIIFRGPRFLNDVFSGKVPFSRPKFHFWWPLFLVSDQDFRIFHFFSQIFRIFTMLNVVLSYMTLSSQGKPLFQKRIPLWQLFYSVRTFARIWQHYFSKYWGDRCMSRPQPQIVLGDRPPSPPRSPPLCLCHRVYLLSLYPIRPTCS